MPHFIQGPPNGLRRLQVILWMLDNNSHSLAPFLLAGSFFILMKILISIPFASSFSATDVMLMSVCQSNDCSSFGGCLGGSAPSMKKRETFPDYIRLPIDSWRFPSKIYEFSPPPRSRGGKWNIASGQIFAMRKARDSIPKPNATRWARSARSEPNQWPTRECTCGTQWVSVYSQFSIPQSALQYGEGSAKKGNKSIEWRVK